MSDAHNLLQEGFPSRDLYPIVFQTLDQYMWDNNPLRPYNIYIWQNYFEKLCIPEFDDEIIVLPTPLNFSVDNDPPQPELAENPMPENGQTVCYGVLFSDIELSTNPYTDPETLLNPSAPQLITYDIYFGKDQASMLIVEADAMQPTTLIVNPGEGQYYWRVVAKDSWGRADLWASLEFSG